MNVNIPQARLRARLTSRAGKDKIPIIIAARFPPSYEHAYSLGKTDIYACKPQYYVSKTDTNGGKR